MTLKPSEVDLLSKLHRQLSDGYRDDELMLRYYEGRHRFAHIGLALPPQYRRISSSEAYPSDSCRCSFERRSTSDGLSVTRTHLQGNKIVGSVLADQPAASASARAS